MEAQAGERCSICPIQAVASPLGHFLPQMPVESRRAGIQALPFLLNCHIFPLYYGDISGPNKLTLYGRFDWDVAQSIYIVTVKCKHYPCRSLRCNIILLKEKRCYKKKG